MTHIVYSRPSTRTPGCRRLVPVLAALLGLGVAPLAAAEGEDPAAAEQTVVYDLPAQPLADSLDAVVTAADIDLLYPTGLVHGRGAPAVSGTMTPEDALRRLLDGSGLRLERLGDGRWVIRRAGDAGTPVSGEGDPIVVEGERTTGYDAETAHSTTKLDAPLRDLPVAVGVVGPQLIEERQIVRLGEIAGSVSGVVHQGGYGGNVDNFTIRGFPSRDILKDGFLIDQFLTMTEMANAEQVEVLKGPAGALYGRNEPGGIVNVVTKRPQMTSHASIGTTVGSEGLGRATLDVGGAIDEQTGTAWRLNVAGEHSDSFRDLNERDSIFLAPVLSWAISPDTEFIVRAEYRYFEGTFDRGFRAEEPFFDLPLDRFLGEIWNEQEAHQAQLSYELTHEFAPGWSFRHALLGNVVRNDILQAQPTGLQGDGRTLDRVVNKTDEENDDIVMQNEVSGRFATGPLDHDLLAGVELARNRFQYIFDVGPVDPIDIFDPSYGAAIGTLSRVSWNEEQYVDALGLYAHDLISIGEQLKILIGGRFDQVRVERENLEGGGTVLDEDYSEFSPRAGLVYQPIPSQSLYLSYSTSFNPELFGTTRGGDPLAPTTAQQFEGGAKSEWLDGRLGTTLSLFHIIKEDVPTADPVDPNFRIQTGEVISRGLEFEATAELLPGWNGLLTYTYTDAYVSEDNTIPEDDVPVNVPEHAASLWTMYEFRPGPLDGFSVGGGAFYVDEREARLPNTDVQLPSYVRLDATVAYARDNWQAALIVKNLTDDEIYNSQGFFVEPQAPLTVQLDLEVRY